jgi:hypothetical protein
MGAKLRDALVQAAHLIADAIESEREGGPGLPRAKPLPVPKVRRKAVRKPFVPERKLSEIEIERARQRARRLGIPV